MFSESRKTTNYVQAITIIVLLLSGFRATLSSQPLLDPLQTVNTATGDMQFSLPLGTVRGVNGHDFPLTLDYKAGIGLNEDASPVGLGFSCDVGGIVRSEIFVNDDNTGGSPNYSVATGGECEQANWIKVWNFVFAVVGVGFSVEAGIGGYLFNEFAYGPPDFKGGGAHVPAYVYNGTSCNGKGFLRGGEKYDVPDVYFCHTPFVDGQIVWAGDRLDGHFIFKVTQGSGRKADETIPVNRTVDENEYTLFDMTMNDGTRIFFEKHDLMPYQNAVWGEYGSTDWHCCSRYIVDQHESVPVSWKMTKILFTDYVDGGGNTLDPLDSRESNKGGWICFKYDSIADTNIIKPWALMQVGYHTTSYMGAGYSNKVKLYRLDSIITPNECAVYNYTMDRKDNLWFRQSNFNNYPMPVLRSISIRGKNGMERSKITFNQSYDIRPYTYSAIVFNPYFMDDWKIHQGTIDASIGTVAGNPSSCALTLNSVYIDGKTSNERNAVLFGYDDSRNYQAYLLDGVHLKYQHFEIDAQCDEADPLKDKFWFLDQKDLWGYYCPAIADTNNFNPGSINKTRDVTRIINQTTGQPYAAAWSLKSAQFMNGMTIDWEYEANRYDRSNGVAVADSGMSFRYGGGIRVKRVNVDNGVSGDRNGNIGYSYFYTSSPTDFNETSGGYSGYASVEPYNYPQNNAAGIGEYRYEASRGGLYTPAKVAYENVKIVTNYRTTAPHAPAGYTMYKFTHSGDPAVPGYYPNYGKYGNIDYSWKRGLLDSVLVYEKNSKVLSRESREYEFNEQHVYTEDIFKPEILNNHYVILLENRCGWVKLKKTESVNLGVKKESVSKYAPDLSVKTPDFVVTTENRIDKMEAWEENYQKYLGIWNGTGNEMVAAFTRTKRFGKTDSTDYVAATLMGSDNSSTWNVNILLGTDLPSVNPPPGTSRPKWIESADRDDPVPLGLEYRNILGLGVANFSGDTSNNDVLLFVGPAEEITAAAVRNNFKCIIFKGIHDNGRGTLEWSGQTEIEFNNSGYPVNNSITLVSCAVGDINGNGAPDVVLLEGEVDDPSAPDIPRRLFGFMDITDSMSFPTGDDTVCCISAAFDSLKGEHISFVDYDGIGGVNDLEITGQAHTGSGHTEPNYPLHRTILRNVSMNMATRVLSTDTPSQLSDYLSLGTRIAKREFYYIGMSQMNDAEDARDRKVFAVYFPVYYSGDRPRLSIIHLYPEEGNGDYDGLPNRTWTRNSDGAFLLSAATPAYWKFPLMGHQDSAGNKHMLTQSCGSVTYGFPAGTADSTLKGSLSGYSGSVVSAAATTWARFDSLWLPKANYAWCVPMNAAGLPKNAYSPFNHAHPDSSDTSWKLGDSICKYTRNSLPKETAKPLQGSSRLYSSAIYGYNGVLPVGSVANARWEECGVYTGDYQSNVGHPDYLDYENGWEKGAGSSLPSPLVTMSDTGHFGDSAVRVVNAYGPARNFRLTQGRDYLMSAWVKVKSGTAWMHGDFRRKSKLADTTWPVTTGLVKETGVDFAGAPQTVTTGKWVLLQMRIPAASLLSGKDWGAYNWYARVFVGAVAGSGGEVYVDDIRFAPSNAQATSTYYDRTLFKPIVSVDANNNPGQFIEYDGFGRLSHLYKFNKSMGSKETGAKTLIQSKEYHLMGRGLIRPYNPTPEDGSSEVLLEDVKLEWECVHPSGKQLEYDVYWGIRPDNLTKLPNCPVTTKYYEKTGLVLDSTYYWQVVARDIEDQTFIKGAVWSFTREYIRLSEWLPGKWHQTTERCSGDSNYVYFNWQPCVLSPNGLEVTVKIEYIDNNNDSLTSYVEYDNGACSNCSAACEGVDCCKGGRVDVHGPNSGPYTITITQTEGANTDSWSRGSDMYSNYDPNHQCQQ